MLKYREKCLGRDVTLSLFSESNYIILTLFPTYDFVSVYQILSAAPRIVCWSLLIMNNIAMQV